MYTCPSLDARARQSHCGLWPGDFSVPGRVDAPTLCRESTLLCCIAVTAFCRGSPIYGKRVTRAHPSKPISHHWLRVRQRVGLVYTCQP